MWRTYEVLSPVITDPCLHYNSSPCTGFGSKATLASQGVRTQSLNSASTSDSTSKGSGTMLEFRVNEITEFPTISKELKYLVVKQKLQGLLLLPAICKQSPLLMVHA